MKEMMNERLTETQLEFCRICGDSVPRMLFEEGTEFDTVMSAYQESKRRGEKEGFVPVLIEADDSYLEEIIDMMDYFDQEKLETYRRKAVDASAGKRFLAEHYAEKEEFLTEDFGETDQDEFCEFLEENPGTDSYPYSFDYEFSALFSPSKTLDVPTLLLEIPTTDPWRIPAFVAFSGYNECPEPDKMTEICKYWFERFGAQIVTICSEGAEMSVAKKPTVEEALEVVKEHLGSEATMSGEAYEEAKLLVEVPYWNMVWD